MTGFVKKEMPQTGVFLWANGGDGIADPLDPEILAQSHTSWEIDARAFDPWQEISSAPCPGEPCDTWWHSDSYAASRVIVSGTCGSSMDLARDFAKKGVLGPWDSVLALSQRAGRGAQKRRWESPAGNIYAALVLPKIDKDMDSVLPLFLGCCIANFMRSLGVDASVKWPNDVLVNDSKICGLLEEEREGLAVAGIGINVVSAPDASLMREGAAVPAACLEQVGLKTTPLALWCALTDSVKACYESFVTRGDVDSILVFAESLLCWKGHVVTVREGADSTWGAVLEGLERDGTLRVTPVGGGGTRILSSASISKHF